MRTKVLQFQKVTAIQERLSSWELTILQHSDIAKDCQCPCRLCCSCLFPKTCSWYRDSCLNWKFIGPPDLRYNFYHIFFTPDTLIMEILKKNFGQCGQEVILIVALLWEEWSEGLGDRLQIRQTCNYICAQLLLTEWGSWASDLSSFETYFVHWKKTDRIIIQ